MGHVHHRRLLRHKPVRSDDLRLRHRGALTVHRRRRKKERAGCKSRDHSKERVGRKLRHRKKEQAGCKSHDHSTERVGRKIRHRSSAPDVHTIRHCSSVPDVHTIRRRYSKDAGSIRGSFRDRLRKSIPEERRCPSDAGRSCHCAVIPGVRSN